MNATLKGYLRLCRPPNLTTAAADVLAGLAIAGFFSTQAHIWDGFFLIFASIFLYAGGVVFNDFFDYELDKSERPERPISSGLISLGNARNFGTILFMIAIVLAGLVSKTHLVLVIILISTILMYDRYAKNHGFFGPLNMGICRGLNLLLGIVIFQDFSNWMYCLIPVVFIFAVTLISRGEVHGNNRKNIAFAGVLYVLAIFFVVVMHHIYNAKHLVYILFLMGFALMVFIPLVRAYKVNEPKRIMKAVKAGVLSIILLDAALAGAHANWQVGILIVVLFPSALGLAKAFAVT